MRIQILLSQCLVLFASWLEWWDSHLNVDTAHPNILVENPGIVHSGCEWFCCLFSFCFGLGERERSLRLVSAYACSDKKPAGERKDSGETSSPWKIGRFLFAWFLPIRGIYWNDGWPTRWTSRSQGYIRDQNWSWCWAEADPREVLGRWRWGPGRVVVWNRDGGGRRKLGQWKNIELRHHCPPWTSPDRGPDGNGRRRAWNMVRLVWLT